LPEPLSDQDREDHKLPLAKAVRDEGRTMLKVIGISVVNAVSFYMIFIYITVYLERQVGLPAATALDVNTGSMIVMLVLMPLFARLSDRFGRKPLLAAAAFGLLLLSYPLLGHAPHGCPDHLRRSTRFLRLGRLLFGGPTDGHGGDVFVRRAL
jgi:MHS family proline/betaine transporter-like MFS transporter